MRKAILKKSIIMTFFIIISGLELFGQKSVSDTISYKNLGEVIVTTNRHSVPLKTNPGAVALVSTPVLASMARSVAVDEALRLVPGVRIDNQANGSRVHLSIRGQGILRKEGFVESKF